MSSPSCTKARKPARCISRRRFIFLSSSVTYHALPASSTTNIAQFSPGHTASANACGNRDDGPRRVSKRCTHQPLRNPTTLSLRELCFGCRISKQTSLRRASLCLDKSGLTTYFLFNNTIYHRN